MNRMSVAIRRTVVALLVGSIAALGADPPTPAPVQAGRATINFPPPGVTLGAALKAISELSGMKLVTSADLAKKPVSLYLPDVTGEEALNSICEVYELHYERQTQTGLVVVKQLDTAVFLLKSANASEVKDVAMALIGDEAGQEVEIDKKNNVLVVRGTRPGIAKIEQFLAQVDGRPRRGSAYFALEHVEAEDIKSIVEALLGESGRAQVDAKNNLIAVEAVDGDIEKVRELIRDIDVPARQVLIEAMIVELNDNAEKNLGIQWNAAAEVTGALRYTKFPFSSDTFWSDSDDDGEDQYGTVSFKDFAVGLEALEEDEEANILASPRIRVLDRKEAEINITTKTPIGVQTTTTSEGGGARVEETQYEEVGVSLKVKPYIHSDGTITLTVEPSVSSASKTSLEGIDGVETFQRTASTTVVVADGETIAIGGLLQEDKKEIVRKFPVLGDLPLLGRLLFTHTTTASDKKDLVVFLSLHIVETKRSAERITGVQDPSESLRRFNEAEGYFEQGSYAAAKILLADLLTAESDDWRRRRIEQYLTAIREADERLPSTVQPSPPVPAVTPTPAEPRTPEAGQTAPEGPAGTETPDAATPSAQTPAGPPAGASMLGVPRHRAKFSAAVWRYQTGDFEGAETLFDELLDVGLPGADRLRIMRYLSAIEEAKEARGQKPVETAAAALGITEGPGVDQARAAQQLVPTTLAGATESRTTTLPLQTTEAGRTKSGREAAVTGAILVSGAPGQPDKQRELAEPVTQVLAKAGDVGVASARTNFAPAPSRDLDPEEKYTAAVWSYQTGDFASAKRFFVALLQDEALGTERKTRIQRYMSLIQQRTKGE